MIKQRSIAALLLLFFYELFPLDKWSDYKRTNI